MSDTSSTSRSNFKGGQPYSRKLEEKLPVYDSNFVAQWQSSLKDPATQMSLVKLLAGVPLFRGTSERFRQELAELMLPVVFHEGQSVFRQGERGHWLGVVAQGRLDRQVVRDAAAGLTKIGDVCPGEVIGDIGLLGVADVRTVTVVAAQRTVLLTLSQTDFDEVIMNNGGPENLPLLEEAHRMQDVMADFETFCRLDCFKKHDPDFVMALCTHLEPRLVYPQSVLMRENNYGNEMYILHVGQVNIEKGGKFIVKLNGGVVLGELAVLGSDKRRSATVTCLTLCLVYVLHGDVFHEILEGFPHSKRVFDHAYISRLVNFELAKVQSEVQSYNMFYGKAHPMTSAQLSEKVWGEKQEEESHRPKTGGHGNYGGHGTMRLAKPTGPPGPKRAPLQLAGQLAAQAPLIKVSE